MDVASKAEHLAIVKYLVEEGKVDPNIKDGWGEAPLDIARQYHRTDVIYYLENEVGAE